MSRNQTDAFHPLQNSRPEQSARKQKIPLSQSPPADNDSDSNCGVWLSESHSRRALCQYPILQCTHLVPYACSRAVDVPCGPSKPHPQAPSSSYWFVSSLRGSNFASSIPLTSSQLRGRTMTFLILVIGDLHIPDRALDIPAKVCAAFTLEREERKSVVTALDQSANICFCLVVQEAACAGQDWPDPMPRQPHR